MSEVNALNKPIILVHKKTISCPPKLSTKWNQHPSVTLRLKPNIPKTCPYCSKTYLLQEKT